MFQSLQEGLQAAFQSLRGKGKLTEANMRDGLAMVERSMIEADVNIDVVRQFMDDVSRGRGRSTSDFVTPTSRRASENRLRRTRQPFGTRRQFPPDETG